MKLVKDKKDEVQELQQVLENRLYRKDIIENMLIRLNKGAVLYNTFAGKLKKQLTKMPKDSLLALKYRKEVVESNLVAEQFIASFKSTKQELEEFVKPQINAVCRELGMKEGDVEYLDIQKTAKALFESEIYGKSKVKSADIELPEVIQHYKAYILLLEKLSDETYNRWEKELDSLEKIRLEIEMFKTNLQLENLEKRLNMRLDYHQNVFLPRFDADMEEAKLYQNEYIKRGKEIAPILEDLKLLHMIAEFENKYEKDGTYNWLFYTALRQRVDELILTMKKDETKYLKHLHLMTPIREKSNS